MKKLLLLIYVACLLVFSVFLVPWSGRSGAAKLPTALGYAPAWAPPAHDDFAVVLDLPRLSTTVLALTIVFAILLYLRREPRPATTRPRLRSIVTGSGGMLCGGASGLVLAEAYREPLAVALCMAILGAIVGLAGACRDARLLWAMVR